MFNDTFQTFFRFKTRRIVFNFNLHTKTTTMRTEPRDSSSSTTTTRTARRFCTVALAYASTFARPAAGLADDHNGVLFDFVSTSTSSCLRRATTTASVDAKTIGVFVAASSRRAFGASDGWGDDDERRARDLIDSDACWFDKEEDVSNKYRFVAVRVGGEAETLLGSDEPWDTRDSGSDDVRTGAVVRKVSVNAGTTLTGLATETARALETKGSGDGDCERRGSSIVGALFDRGECFGGEDAMEGAARADAVERVKGYVTRELECFEAGLVEFARDEARAGTVAHATLQGAAYAAKKFGSKSETARWSASETTRRIRAAMRRIEQDGGADFGALIQASDSGGFRASERSLLGLDSAHSAERKLSESTPNDNDVEAVKKFNIKAVQWVVVIVLIGAAVGGVFALLGMPLIQEPLLYAPIPGTKLD